MRKRQDSTTGAGQRRQFPPPREFIELDDCPDTYAGQAAKFPQVNDTENALVFAEAGITDTYKSKVTATDPNPNFLSQKIFGIDSIETTIDTLTNNGISDVKLLISAKQNLTTAELLIFAAQYSSKDDNPIIRAPNVSTGYLTFPQAAKFPKDTLSEILLICPIPKFWDLQPLNVELYFMSKTDPTATEITSIFKARMWAEPDPIFLEGYFSGYDQAQPLSIDVKHNLFKLSFGALPINRLSTRDLFDSGIFIIKIKRDIEDIDDTCSFDIYNPFAVIRYGKTPPQPD